MRQIYSVLAIAMLGLAVLAGCNSAEHKSSSAGPLASQTPPTVAPTDGIRRITVVELRSLVEKNEALVVDVRNQEAYNLSHIQGAKLIPVADTLKHIDELPKDQLIVTYCA